MLPAPLVSSWVFADAFGAADSADGVAVSASAGAVAAMVGNAKGGSAGAGAEAAAAAPIAALGRSAKSTGRDCCCYCGGLTLTKKT